MVIDDEKDVAGDDGRELEHKRGGREASSIN